MAFSVASMPLFHRILWKSVSDVNKDWTCKDKDKVKD